MYTEVRAICIKTKWTIGEKIPQWIAVGGCAHILVACHLVVYDMEEKTYEYHGNRKFV